MVIVIIGVLSVLTIPSFSGSDTARVKSASRAVMQMSRYARSMAVLHQCDMKFVLQGGKLAVSTGEKYAAADISGAYGGGADGASSEGGGDGEEGEADVNDISSIGAEKEFEQIVFEVELDSRAASSEETLEGFVEGEAEPDDEKGGAASGRCWTISYAGNGRCLPYRVFVRPADEEGNLHEGAFSLTVEVDRFGRAKILDADED